MFAPTSICSRRVASLVVAALSLTALGAKSRPRRPLVIAHRGASHDAPENTLAAFNLAWQQGADGAEGDFYLSADGQIVCIHDADTQRTAGENLRVAHSTLAELQQLDVGSWKSAKFAGERIPTLSDVLQTVPRGKLFYIEIKCGPEIIPALVDLLHSQHSVAFDQLRIISFNTEVIAAAKQQLPAIKAFWLTGYKEQQPEDGAIENHAPQFTPTAQTVLETLAATRADGLGSNANVNVVDALYADALRQAGYELHVWTVDDREVAKRMHALGALSITTNLPAEIRRLWSADDVASRSHQSESAWRTSTCERKAVPCCRRRCTPRRRLHPRMFRSRW